MNPPPAYVIAGITRSGLKIPLLLFPTEEQAFKYLRDAGSESGLIPSEVQAQPKGEVARDFWEKFITGTPHRRDVIDVLAVCPMEYGSPFLVWKDD